MKISSLTHCIFWLLFMKRQQHTDQSERIEKKTFWVSKTSSRVREHVKIFQRKLAIHKVYIQTHISSAGEHKSIL